MLLPLLQNNLLTVVVARQAEQPTGGGRSHHRAPSAKDHIDRAQRERERIRLERERLGIIPKKIRRVISKIAQKQVAEHEPLGIRFEQLRRAVEAANYVYKPSYFELFQAQVARAIVEQLKRHATRIREQREREDALERDDEDVLLILLAA